MGCEYCSPFHIIEIVFIIPKGNETRGSVAVITTVGVIQDDVVTIDGVGHLGHIGVRSELKSLGVLILYDRAPCQIKAVPVLSIFVIGPNILSKRNSDFSVGNGTSHPSTIIHSARQTFDIYRSAIRVINHHDIATLRKWISISSSAIS